MQPVVRRYPRVALKHPAGLIYSLALLVLAWSVSATATDGTKVCRFHPSAFDNLLNAIQKRDRIVDWAPRGAVMLAGSSRRTSRTAGDKGDSVAYVSTYLNFSGTTEMAFTFYKSVFGTEFSSPIMRYGDMPAPDGSEGGSDELKNMVINVQLPITAGHLLMGTDVSPEMGSGFTQGDNVYICLHPDTRAETDRLFAALAEGGTVENQAAEMFWGDYWSSLRDKFGTQWMFNCTSKE